MEGKIMKKLNSAFLLVLLACQLGPLVASASNTSLQQSTELQTPGAIEAVAPDTNFAVEQEPNSAQSIASEQKLATPAAQQTTQIQAPGTQNSVSTPAHQAPSWTWQQVAITAGATALGLGAAGTAIYYLTHNNAAAENATNVPGNLAPAPIANLPAHTSELIAIQPSSQLQPPTTPELMPQAELLQPDFMHAEQLITENNTANLKALKDSTATSQQVPQGTNSMPKTVDNPESYSGWLKGLAGIGLVAAGTWLTSNPQENSDEDVNKKMKNLVRLKTLAEGDQNYGRCIIQSKVQETQDRTYQQVILRIFASHGKLIQQLQFKIRPESTQVIGLDPKQPLGNLQGFVRDELRHANQFLRRKDVNLLQLFDDALTSPQYRASFTNAEISKYRV